MLKVFELVSGLVDDEDDCLDDDGGRWQCLYIETTNKVGLRRDLGDRDRGWITNIGHRRITQNIINFGPE